MKPHLAFRNPAPAVALLAWLLLPQTGHSFYNPSTGRWLSRDPIEEKGGLNPCAFAQNAPVSSRDALGLAVIVIAGETKCDLAKPPGSPMTVTIYATGCDKPCTQEHEDTHVKNLQACCDKARAAYQAVGADRSNVEERWKQFEKDAENYTECEAYMASSACLASLYNKTCYRCTFWYTPDERSCCSRLQISIGKDREQREHYCGQPSAYIKPACPF